ncbi:MAG: cryptochrome/photolyase family protein, partial [Deltaproteobacteria bacterium]|nr:cryptochrome/photolyase family protein [Deltaproteobacteria bacterium]
MSEFISRLRALTAPLPTDTPRRWVFAPYDQLTDRVGPLSADPTTLGLVLVECPGKARRRPYHRQKLALVLANLRHFALEQAARGVLVRHLTAPSYAEALRRLVAEVGPVTMMEAAERELRHELAPLVSEGLLHVVPHAGWLSTPEDFAASQKPAPPWKMEPFYQHLRKKTGLLMEGGKPLGGRFNFDDENRRPWRPERGDPPAPTPPRFTPDAVTREVGTLIEEHFARHPGTLDLGALPATQADADHLWQWAMDACLPYFGPFEDALSTRSSGLFHTRIAPLLNLHRLLPRDIVRDVAALPIEHPSKEGFIRQVLGWREYVHHVHRATDGFRRAPAPASATAPHPGDGGYAGWSGAPWYLPRDGDAAVDGGACPSALGAASPVPPAYWGTPSGLRCLDTVVADVWREGYSHHITRLMVLANLGTTLGLSPRALTDWFWVAYTDAYDWVVEPNVLGMGTYALGGLMTTKPYVSGAAYIDKMS